MQDIKELEVGDKVVITDTGQLYSSYSDAAKRMKLTKWSEQLTTIKHGEKGIVVGLCLHHQNSNVRIIGFSNGINEFIIGESGVELLEASTYVPEQKSDELFFDVKNLLEV